MQIWKPREERGQVWVVGLVVGLLVFIAVGAMVFYQVTGALKSEAGSRAENTINNVEEKGVTVFNLMSILAIVLVAAAIIGVVVGAVGGYGRRAPAPAPAPEEIVIS